MRKPHVALVGHSAGAELYGAERSLLDLLAAIDSDRFEVSCVLPGHNDGYLASIAKHAKAVHVFPYQWWNAARSVDEDNVSRFAAFFEGNGVDLVHVNTITLMEPLVAARRVGIPSVVHAREIITEDQELVGILGGGLIDAGAIVEAVQSTADFIIANSDATYRLYGEGGRSYRLYNTIDVDGLDITNERRDERLTVGIISSNRRLKGIGEFAALAKLSAHRADLEFVVIGPRNPYVAGLEHGLLAEAIPVRLRFTDYFADPLDALRQLNVVMSLSIVAESFGRTILEGMAARRPVVAYDWGATSELVRHGETGFLIPYLEFPAALVHLETLADHPNLMDEMGLAGRARAEAHFSRSVFAAGLDEIYQQIFERSGLSNSL